MEKLNNQKFFSLEKECNKTESLTGFPANTNVFVKMEKVIKHGEKDNFVRLSQHMVKCASVLPVGEHIGWQMLIPKKGLIEMTLFGSESLQRKDLEWFAGNTAKTSKSKQCKNKSCTNNELYELYLPVAETSSTTIGFNAGNPKCSNDNFAKWPMAYPTQFSELVNTLQQDGAEFRAVVGAATEDEKENCRKNTIRTLDSARIDATAYIGKPVRTRFLLRLADKPTIRLKSVLEEMVPGSKLRYLGSMNSQEVNEIWDYPLHSSNVLPDYAARIMLLEPGLKEAIVGIEVCEEEMKRIPMSHKNIKSKGSLLVGKAVDVTGVKKNVLLAEKDIKRHYQIIGQTGCGKSTLLTSIILSAIEKGNGLTFFDPHGSTIDTIIRCVPEKYADRIRVVRIGDKENPVPLNIWDSSDPVKEERLISDLVELFTDIFDPKREGFVGPRWERWFSTFAKASIAFLGHRASLESIAVISQNQDNMLKVSKAIISKYPELVEIIKQEYGLDKSNDFHATLSWLLCKLQRLTSVEQLRKTLGAGVNALDFNNSIDTNMVTLIDLALPDIGTNAARTIGTLMLMKLWNAAITRKNRDRTHLVVLDEASLFMTNPLPRMLAEGRKFGISCVISHQHASQMTTEIRDAIESNSANFTAFRLSPKDAANAAIRFDNPEILTFLTRLDAFNAITTLSVDGKQSAPFTLQTIRPKFQKNAEEIAEKIERTSIEKLVNPYRHLRALTQKEIQDMLNYYSNKKVEAQPKKDDIPKKQDDNQSEDSVFMSDWSKYKQKNAV